eukprot:CAMPEP_0196739056 /NCGR_PEP_ID=MMETSP1091-20130531/19290_1 /TAXON_ID=302021 /ORGANISM="Rhodomonas sp., Strain CCMP768" /LENGTH=35 /DNA_ID= /DNA_START= /DNA_END= /DNA_ORIENTATION=
MAMISITIGLGKLTPPGRRHHPNQGSCSVTCRDLV